MIVWIGDPLRRALRDHLAVGVAHEEVILLAKKMMSDAIGGFAAFTTETSNGYSGISFVWMPEYAGFAPEQLEQHHDAVMVAFRDINKYMADKKFGTTVVSQYRSVIGWSDNYDQVSRELRSP